MNKRHDKLGIKQTIQKHWMDHVIKMLLAGLSEKEIRAELTDFWQRKNKGEAVETMGKKPAPWP